MRRGARLALYGGIVVAVVGLSVYHSRAIADPPYSYTGTFRFGWSLLYIGVLMVTAYGLGLPELPRTAGRALRHLGDRRHQRRRRHLRPAAASPATPCCRASSCSAPPSCWCPGTCSARRSPSGAASARPRATGCCSSGHADEAAPLRVDLRRAPERSASVAGVVLPESVAQPVGQAAGRRPARPAGRRAQRHRRRARRGGRGRRLGHRPGRRAPLPGHAAAQLRPVHRRVAGQGARSPTSSGPRCCSTSARSTGPATAG